jgi:hypothetical protein
VPAARSSSAFLALASRRGDDAQVPTHFFASDFASNDGTLRARVKITIRLRVRVLLIVPLLEA